MAKDESTMIHLTLGLGYFMQGFRCSLWMLVYFFLKVNLQVDPSTLQMLQNITYLSLIIGKLSYGISSDAYYINGRHRFPYISLGAGFQAVVWLWIACLLSTRHSVFEMSIYLFVDNLGASISAVGSDAIVVEISKRKIASKNVKSSSSGELQSFAWMASSLGGVLGSLLVVVTIDRFSAHALFFVCGIMLLVQYYISLTRREETLNLAKNPSDESIKKQMLTLLAALHKPEIAKAVVWFTASYALIPALSGVRFFSQTQIFNTDSSVLMMSKLFAQSAMLFWGVIYNKQLKLVSSRKLITSIQATISVLIVSDILFVNNFYRKLGVSDSLYLVLFPGLLEALYFSKILPFSVIIAQLCPTGCEGSLMGFVMSAVVFAFILSRYLAVAIASYLGITSSDFSGSPKCILISVLCTLAPLFWSSWIPDNVKPKVDSGKKTE